MSTPDPTDLMLNDAAYDELLKDAEKDNRVGDHEAMISSVTHDTWDDGSPRTKVNFVLLTANNAKADLTMSVPPPPEVVRAEKHTWEPKRLKGIASSVAIQRQLAEHYGTKRQDLREGQRYKVKTAKTRREADGTGGFIRVIAFLPKDRPVGAASNGSAPASSPSAPAPAF